MGYIMILRLNDLNVECIIGERDYERERPQTVIIDVELEIDDRSSLTDELSDTVDYARLSSEISRELVQAKCKMIERASRIICETCLKNVLVRRAKAVITKVGCVENLGSASCEFELTKSRIIC
jgi:dihydroneopterin aldolase